MIKIACVGDNVVDINYVDGMINPGGNCVNAAVYAKQLGHDVSYVGILADDLYAKVLTDSFDKIGVRYDHCVTMHGETGRCFCSLVDGERILGDENDGGLVKSDPLVLTDELIGYLRQFDVVHTSCYSYIDDQLYKFKEAGIPVVYDFSTAWNKENLAKVCPYVTYVLFSDKEGIDRKESLAMLREVTDTYGCELAIMTMGKKGACVYDGYMLYEKKPYNVEAGAIDTTGCGDSWISAFITTYTECYKRLSDMKAAASENLILEENERDFRKNVIHISMCMGNLKARHTTLIKGGYGYGISIEEFNKNAGK